MMRIDAAYKTWARPATGYGGALLGEKKRVRRVMASMILLMWYTSWICLRETHITSIMSTLRYENSFNKYILLYTWYYFFQVVMANCMPLNSTDNFATSGVIHTVNKVLHPVNSSLFDLISQRPEFSILLNSG